MPHIFFIIFLIYSKYNKKRQDFCKSNYPCIFAFILAYALHMKELKCYLIIGTIFVLIAGTLAHFVYGWSGQNRIIGFFFPVSESTWEHMKLCFFPMLVYSLYRRPVTVWHLHRHDEKIQEAEPFLGFKFTDNSPCLNGALPAGILAGTFAVPVLFYTYTGILGQSFLPLDIGVFIASVLLAFFTIYRLTLSCKAKHYQGLLWLGVAILGLCFVVFTYHPPKIGFFSI